MTVLVPVLKDMFEVEMNKDEAINAVVRGVPENLGKYEMFIPSRLYQRISWSRHQNVLSSSPCPKVSVTLSHAYKLLQSAQPQDVLALCSEAPLDGITSSVYIGS